MDLYDVIRTRRSVRSFLSSPIPREVITRILEAARLAPSASNKMPWKFVVVTDAEKRKAIAVSGVYGKFLAQSPAVIVGCGDVAKAAKWFMVDTAIALEHVALAATAEGLGSCWIGSFDETTVKSLLKVPDNYRVVCLMALGYPKEKIDLASAATHLRRTKGIEDIASSEEFGNAWEKEVSAHPG